MRIVICDYSGHPFQVELSRYLAGRGHPTLHLHFAGFQTPKGALTKHPGDPASFQVEGVGLDRAFDKTQFLRRRFLEVKVGKRIAERASDFKPDVVVGCNMPLDAQRELRKACARRGIAFIFWLQDIYSEAIHHYLTVKFGLLGGVVGRYYRHIESSLLRSSDAVVAISGKFVKPLTTWGVRADRMTVIANWAPLSEICPVAKDNPWSRRHGFHDKTVALYTGTLGLKHDPSLLLDLARAGQCVGLHLVVVSEGAGANWLAERRNESGLTNLTVLPFQPMKRYSEVLGAGDILLAMVGVEAAAFSVPSKILSYLAAGKPVVASIAGDNDAALMIAEAGSGSVVEPGDRKAFFDKVLELAVNPELRGTMGEKARRFAVDQFAVEAIGDRFTTILTAARAGVDIRHHAKVGRQSRRRPIEHPKAAPMMTPYTRG